MSDRKKKGGKRKLSGRLSLTPNTRQTKRQDALNRAKKKYGQDKVRIQLLVPESIASDFTEIKNELNVSSNCAGLEALINA